MCGLSPEGCGYKRAMNREDKYRKPKYKEAGEILAIARIKAGYISQSALSRALGEAEIEISPEAISKWELGQSFPGSDKYEILSRVLNIDIKDLAKHRHEAEYKPISYLPEGGGKVTGIEEPGQDDYDDMDDGEWQKAAHRITAPPPAVFQRDLYALNTSYCFPKPREFVYLYGRLTSERAADIAWPEASFLKKLHRVSRCKLCLERAENFGHGEDFWMRHVARIVDNGRFPDTPRALDPDIYEDYVNAYLAAKTGKDNEALSQKEEPFTLRQLTAVTEYVQENAAAEEWYPLGIYAYPEKKYGDYIAHQPAENRFREYANCGPLHGIRREVFEVIRDVLSSRPAGYKKCLLLDLIEVRDCDLPSNEELKKCGTDRGEIEWYDALRRILAQEKKTGRILQVRLTKRGKYLNRWAERFYDMLGDT